MPAPLAPWTQDRVTMLIHLWDEAGESAATIARMLGGTSRSAVMGKLHRLAKLGNANRPARTKAPSRVRLPLAHRKPAARRLPLLRRPARSVPSGGGTVVGLRQAALGLGAGLGGHAGSAWARSTSAATWTT